MMLSSKVLTSPSLKWWLFRYFSLWDKKFFLSFSHVQKTVHKVLKILQPTPPPPPPTCVFRLEFQPVLLSEPARSAEKFLPFFGYQAAIPTCAVVWGFREMRRLVGGGGSILYHILKVRSKSEVSYSNLKFSGLTDAIQIHIWKKLNYV